MIDPRKPAPRTHRNCLALCVPGEKQRAFGLGPGSHGLRLVVSPSGTGAWVQRLWQGGRSYDRGLGPIGYVTLAQAKQLAFANKAAKYLERTAGPLEPIRPRNPSGPTFEALAREVISERAESLRNERQSIHWTKSLERWAFPIIGSMKVADVARADVLRIFEQDADGGAFWTAKPTMAQSVLSRVRIVLDKAVARELLKTNPADKALEAGLPNRNGRTKHHEAIPYADLPAAMRTLEAASGSSALCLRLIALTAVRAHEARGAQWSEIDLDAKLWTIPAGRMKAGREHQVPLSDAALAVLAEARELSGGSEFAFLGANRKAVSPATLRRQWLRSGVLGTRHGLRSAFSAWAQECTDASDALIDACLAHSKASVTASYLRSTVVEKRRAIMARWGEYLTATHG